jgi:hypothetical protein
MRYLSRVDYLNVMRCPKLLWLAVHQPELAAESDEWAAHLMAEASRVRKLAQQLFPHGVVIHDGHRSLPEMRALTKIAQAIEMPALFHVPAGDRELGVCCEADVLSLMDPDEDRWVLTEVVSCTKIKPEHLSDLAFQMICMAGSDTKIQSAKVIHLNGEYQRRDDIDIGDLFTTVDVTEQVQGLLCETRDRISEMRTLVDSTEEPTAGIGPCCKYPARCAFYEKCHAEIPEASVFELPNNRGQAQKLWDCGFELIKNVPECLINSDRHLAIWHSAQVGTPVIDVTETASFLGSLKFPLYFLDFESCASAIPLFQDARPYQQIPFQFSLHRMDSLEGPVSHVEFIADDLNDPRKRLTEALLPALGDSGSILTWNQGFEKGVLKHLGEQFGEYGNQIDGVVNRIEDLIVVFRNGWYADTAFKGSFSLKSVLPAVCPHLSYKSLPGMQSGTEATLIYFRYIMGIAPPDEWQVIRKHLSAYCHLDTWAMVELLRVLHDACSRKEEDEVSVSNP